MGQCISTIQSADTSLSSIVVVQEEPVMGLRKLSTVKSQILEENINDIFIDLEFCSENGSKSQFNVNLSISCERYSLSFTDPDQLVQILAV